MTALPATLILLVLMSWYSISESFMKSSSRVRSIRPQPRIASYAQLQKARIGRKLNSFGMVSNTIVLEETNANLDKELSDGKPLSLGTSTMITSSTNLMKNCIGAGVFSLTAKLISIQTPDIHTIIKGMLVILTMASWAAHNFWIIGESCSITNSSNFAELWGKTVSKSTDWIIQSVVVLSPIVSCLANTIVLTDVLKSLIIGIGLPVWMTASRPFIIFLLGAGILFPLCSLKDLSALKSVSGLGVAGQLLSMLILTIRLLDGSYFPGGKYYMSPSAAIAAASVPDAMTSVIASVSTGASSVATDPMKWFVFSSLLSYCFVTHYNAPRYYTELKNSNSKRVAYLATISYGCASLVYIGTMILGIKLFGVDAKSFLLNNLMSSDPLALVARAAFGTSVLASTPLIFLSARTWLMTVMSKRSQAFSGIKPVAALLLTLICSLAVAFNDVAVVGSLSGAIFGSAMMFIFPPVIYIRALQKRSLENGTRLPWKRIVFNTLLLLTGGTMGILGTYNSVTNALKVVL